MLAIVWILLSSMIQTLVHEQLAFRNGYLHTFIIINHFETNHSDTYVNFRFSCQTQQKQTSNNSLTLHRICSIFVDRQYNYLLQSSVHQFNPIDLSPTSDTSCHVIDWLYTGFGLVIGFIEHLQNVTTNNYDSLNQLHTSKITATTAHVILLSLVCLHQSLPGDGSQQCPVLPQSHSYWLATVSQLTHCCNCQLSTNWLSLTALLVRSRHRLHRRHRSSVAVSSCCHANMLVCKAVTQ
jgi:hypothetical protein